MGEKDTNTMKQIEMPGFEVTGEPKNTLLEYRQKPLLSSKQTESTEFSKTTPRSVLELINLIETKPSHVKNKDKQESFKVKMIDEKHWINFNSEKIGKAAILFIFLSDKQYPNTGDAAFHIAEMEELSRELYLPNREVAENILEQVGVYLFSRHERKAKDRNLYRHEILEGIEYCLDPTNRLTIKAMVQENRGIELPSHYHN